MSLNFIRSRSIENTTIFLLSFLYYKQLILLSIDCIHSTYLVDSAGRPAVSLGSDPLEGKTPVAENRITENHVAVDFGQHRGVTDPRRSHTLLFNTLRSTHQHNSLLFGFLLGP